MRFLFFLLFIGLYSTAGCVPLLGQQKRPAGKTQEGAAITNRPAGMVRVFESTEHTVGEPEEQSPVSFGPQRAAELTIFVDDTRRYQAIEGFGASLTDSSAWLIRNKLSDSQSEKLMERLFDPEKGIGLSLLRQPMGSSDFALEDYTYDDMPPGQSDPDLQHFSIEKDQRYIIPVLRAAMAINPKIKILATPWSPPAWMKSNDSLVQGSLRPENYAALAGYFVKFVKAYEQAGVPIFAVTIQNEPLNAEANFPSLLMSSGEQAGFLGSALGPAFRAAGLRTKIFIFDHNWDLTRYPIEVLADKKAAAYVSGIAIHCYGGNAAAQSELHERFPNLPIWLTECSGGSWQRGNLLDEQVRLIIDSTRSWSQSVILWNLALDQNHEPHLGGCKDCRGVITVNATSDGAEAIPTVDFTALAHVSKFVRPGARRIESNSFGPGSLEDVAFRNPDGSLVLLVLNSGSKPVTFNLSWKGKYAVYTLPGNSAATFTWR
ncbi:MAG TPA: glycoside hydrolase family 30 beta sandwich domain-containing protein [Candidatus Acidoferrum sp.]|nr:glycoside hydrolase family 30 beta sandwich domain-containing protein [Candidatus Acidoferrum sp.]